MVVANNKEQNKLRNKNKNINDSIEIKQPENSNAIQESSEKNTESKNSESVDQAVVNEKIDYSKLNKNEKLLYDFGFYENFGCGTNIYDKYYSESFKQVMALKKVSNSVKTEKKCSEIYTETREGEPGAYKGQNGVCYEDIGTTLIPYDEANKIYKSMYGENMPKKRFNTLNYGFYYNFYDYNESLNSFVRLECGGCGGACGGYININKIKSAYTIEDNLVIDVYYYNGGIDWSNKYFNVNTSKGHIDLESTKTKVDFSIGPELDKVIKAAEKEIEEKYLDKLDVYEVVFTKKDGNYIFKSLTKKLS